MLVATFQTYSTWKAQKELGDKVYYQLGDSSMGASFRAYILKQTEAYNVAFEFDNLADPYTTPPTFLTDFPNALLSDTVGAN